MNTIDPELISGIIASAYTDININQNTSIVKYFQTVHTENEMQRHIVNAILDNAQSARTHKIPLCQDTGIPIIFIELPPGTGLPANLKEHIKNALNASSVKHGMRMSISTNTLENSAGTDNTPVIHILPAEGEECAVTVMAKGGGSENVSNICIMSHADSMDHIAEYIIKTVENASSRACPPYILGVGIGGSVEQCALNSKKALTGVFGHNSSKEEQSISDKVMALSEHIEIGIQGMGFGDTVLDCRVIISPSHIATLPVAVSFSCFQERVKRVVL